ncbi:hypothetical protein [Pseudooceanicola nanhaiensis]|uniref:hypothetical protein n=1 Tax=Pseudooceanicola nanhaiensis TaxID=375761 RepID=UPI001CD1B825|nr:hypothetical protein [Pseudooceanicola nanhaiensis]MCA0919835.1 hypothetical protein [Pseudooceanicola nanhaiensis]
MIVSLAMQSLGVGIGVFVGILIGLGMRKRKGNVEGLLAGSVVLTALAAGALAMAVMMALKYVSG